VRDGKKQCPVGSLKIYLILYIGRAKVGPPCDVPCCARSA
jgi:hypothetical protein